jgi:hypothetical protein
LTQHAAALLSSTERKIEPPRRPLRERAAASGTANQWRSTMATAPRAKSATLTINPHNQNLESVHRLVAQVLGMAGCSHCGRIALLRVDFLGDPPPELSKEGVISVETTGF